MKALFEVKTIEAEWKPPFKKNVYIEEFTASQNDGFDRITRNGNDEPIFRVLELSGSTATIKFSPLFTIKEKKDSHGKDKTMTMTRGEEEILSYLWGERGLTKKITYKGITPTEMAKHEEQNQEEQPEEMTQTVQSLFEK